MGKKVSYRSKSGNLQIVENGDINKMISRVSAELQGDIQKKALREVNKTVKPRMQQVQRGMGIISSIKSGKANKRSAKAKIAHGRWASVTDIKTKVFFNETQGRWLGLTGPAAEAWYAKIIEYGGNIKLWGKATKKIMPRPFRKVTTLAVKNQAIAIIKQVTLAEIKKIRDKK